jgi:hypothetical protein
LPPRTPVDRTTIARKTTAKETAPKPTTDSAVQPLKPTSVKAKPERVHPQGATPPYPDRPPKWLALRACDAANTTSYLSGWAYQITLMLARNRWLWLLTWVGLCLLLSTTWDVETMRSLFASVDAPPPPPPLEATASTTWGRLGVNVLLSIPIVSVLRLMLWLSRPGGRA